MLPEMADVSKLKPRQRQLETGSLTVGYPLDRRKMLQWCDCQSITSDRLWQEMLAQPNVMRVSSNIATRLQDTALSYTEFESDRVQRERRLPSCTCKGEAYCASLSNRQARLCVVPARPGVTIRIG